jgi:hypothetical protein
MPTPQLPAPGPPAPTTAPFPVRVVPADPAAGVTVTASELAGWAYDLGLLAHYLAHTAALPRLGPGDAVRGTRRTLVEILTRMAARVADLTTTPGPTGPTCPKRRTETAR